MRPLRLELKGFTAFRDPVEIDFTGLDLFAISGPTGSGKSSLLDAMTYALYGRVERVGDRVGQLISQGQKRMAVTLEFEVGRDRYQLTRTTPAKGATKIHLMRWIDGGWEQAGEGSDRVRDVEKILARTIGLTYDGFTRSVLLPQGKFAELLVGDPKKRRDILTELLGLSLFKHMAERAGALGREAAVRSETTTGLLESEFADATPEALKEARAALKEAEKRKRTLGRAAERVILILERWQESKRSIQELRACAEEAGDAARQASETAQQLERLMAQLQDAAGELDERTAASKRAQEDVDLAQAALREAEAASGPAAELAKAQVWANSLVKASKDRTKKETDHARATDRAGALASALEQARGAVIQRRAATAEQEAALREAEAVLEKARHVNLVAAVSAGLKAGDPCPVCGASLRKAPRPTTAGTAALERATRAVEKAKHGLEAARARASQAEREADGAAREVEVNAAEQQRLTADVEELDRLLREEIARLEGVLGAPLPEDPHEEIDVRLARLQALARAEREAERGAVEAARALVLAEQGRDRVVTSIDRQRDRLGVTHRPLLERAIRAMDGQAPAVELPPPPETGQSGALETYAGSVARTLADLASLLVHEVDRRSSLEARLLDEATDVVGNQLEPAPTLERLAQAVNAACMDATAEAARVEELVKDLGRKIERKRQFQQEVKLLDDRARTFRQLATELRADHLIAFLQAEALQLLAAAGSERLGGLSDGRYRLACRQDEFLVVDTWNGDEERSVRTLSGGETFLASLALALALADQVRSLSVTDRARLDSLFLDEGFGTLDPETLRTVTDGIEQLAGDGRLVGVVTHVRELAEQFPRIQVEKTPRGSHVRVTV
jgi:DNA repair protein SbcC/Rad50